VVRADDGRLVRVEPYVFRQRVKPAAKALAPAFSPDYSRPREIGHKASYRSPNRKRG
jgi:hypothetical protein